MFVICLSLFHVFANVAHIFIFSLGGVCLVGQLWTRGGHDRHTQFAQGCISNMHANSNLICTRFCEHNALEIVNGDNSDGCSGMVHSGLVHSGYP